MAVAGQKQAGSRVRITQVSLLHSIASKLNVTMKRQALQA